MIRKPLLGIIFTLAVGTISAQSIDSLKSNFINWRISKILETECPISGSIQIEDSFESWSSEKRFVDNYLKGGNRKNLDAMWSEDQESEDILDSLRLVLTSNDYDEIATQLSQSITLKQSGLGIKYSCNGNGQPISFKMTKPIVILTHNLIIVTEIVQYQNNNCSTRQITSYKKINAQWVEFLNFFRSNVCV